MGKKVKLVKVLIVDDEKPIRQWFTFTIEKSGRPYQVVGEAANGKEALAIFREHLPDLVITDIRMPVMDGIELMREIKAIAPATDVVILTCYPDFDYAREAVKQGAFDYMLKAEVQDRDILDLLEKIRIKREQQGNLMQSLQIHRRVQMNAWLDDLIKGKLAGEEQAEKRLRELKIHLADHFLFAMAIRPDTIENGNRVDPLAGLAGSFYSFIYESDKLILLGSLPKSNSRMAQRESLFKLAGEVQRAVGGSIGVSNLFSGFTNIRTACKEALALLNLEFYQGRGSIILTDKKVEYLNLPEIQELEKRIIAAIEAQDGSAVMARTKELLMLLEKGNVLDVQGVRRICHEILGVLSAKAYLNGESDSVGKLKFNIAEELRRKRYFRELSDWVLEVAETMIEAFKIPEGKYSAIVKRALDYLGEHYNEAVSLKEIAALVHLNPNYFCQLFKAETGENFSNYLTSLRLKKAEELLKNTDLRAYEIAEKIGYPNLSYFSRIFKKYTGKSPFEYRNS
jgi:two-component system response regulator YesN